MRYKNLQKVLHFFLLFKNEAELSLGRMTPQGFLNPRIYIFCSSFHTSNFVVSQTRKKTQDSSEKSSLWVFGFRYLLILLSAFLEMRKVNSIMYQIYLSIFGGGDIL